MSAPKFIGIWLAVATACAVNAFCSVSILVSLDYFVDGALMARAQYITIGLSFLAGQIFVHVQHRKELHK